MSRAKIIGVAAVLLAASGAAAFGDVLFKSFIPGQSTATQPLASGDYLAVIQGGATTKMSGSNFVTLNDTQTLSNKTINDSSNSVTIHATSITGTLLPSQGGLGLTTCASGAINYWSSTSAIGCSLAGAANAPIIWGGAGVAPSAGSRSGNTTLFVTGSGSYTSGDGVSVDVNGNVVDNANAAFVNKTQTWTQTQTFSLTPAVPTAAQTATGAFAASLDFVKSQSYSKEAAWLVGANPNGGVVILRSPIALTVTGIWCRLTTTGDTGATIDVYAAASGTGGTGGTKLNTTSCSANQTVNNDQQLLTGTTTIPANQSVYLVATGTFAASAGGIGLQVHP